MEFEIQTNKREEVIDITSQIEEVISKNSNDNSKICLVYVPHTTCAAIINENYDPNVCDDIINFLQNIIPRGKWKHDKIDGNGDAHVKSSIIGCSELIPIKNKKLQLGRWQNIALAEFDGSRNRKIIVKII